MDYLTGSQSVASAFTEGRQINKQKLAFTFLWQIIKICNYLNH